MREIRHDELVLLGVPLLQLATGGEKQVEQQMWRVVLQCSKHHVLRVMKLVVTRDKVQHRHPQGGQEVVAKLHFVYDPELLSPAEILVGGLFRGLQDFLVDVLQRFVGCLVRRGPRQRGPSNPGIVAVHVVAHVRDHGHLFAPHPLQHHVDGTDDAAFSQRHRVQRPVKHEPDNPRARGHGLHRCDASRVVRIIKPVVEIDHGVQQQHRRPALHVHVLLQGGNVFTLCAEVESMVRVDLGHDGNDRVRVLPVANRQAVVVFCVAMLARHVRHLVITDSTRACACPGRIATASTPPRDPRNPAPCN
eukprot:m.334193 g.334193  ORF g.334193 m.334193 type:complete len:305 (-) comp20505_c0_seq38:382-1296(-)